MPSTAPKPIAVIGSTGSIGTQTLEIVREHPGRFRVALLAAGSNADLLIRQAVEFRPSMAVIADTTRYNEVKEALAPLGIEVAAGATALADAMTRPDFDTVVTATVGYSGLLPTVTALRAGKHIALANKETLVVAGEIVTGLAAANGCRLWPVDSEHSAIAQCLAGESHGDVRRLIITASGGPFRNMTAGQLAAVTPAQALCHPNWKMGAKITIDSATMMNKAFEIIEARWLFDIPGDRIVPLVHPQSVVHSMVEFCDGAVKAQLGVPDMKLPIAYALGEHSRLPGISEPLGLDRLASLTFELPDAERFPCLGLAQTALSRQGNSACIINAANEVANRAFRDGKLRFDRIYGVIMEALDNTEYISDPTLDDLVATDAEARRVAAEAVTALSGSPQYIPMIQTT